jgi:general stress protein 26
MNSKNRRYEAGGNPAQGPHPDVANPAPSAAVGEDFPDQPHEHPAERPQDQPDLDAFAARMGTDRLAGDSSGDDRTEGTADDTSGGDTDTADDTSSDDNTDDPSGGDTGDDTTRDWRAPITTALGGLASGARTASERLKGVSERLVTSDAGGELDLAALRQRVRKVTTVMLTSIDERGTLSARPLIVQHVSESGDVHFVVDRDADWLSSDMEPVNVAFVDAPSTWISVAGRAVLDDDSQLLDDLWNPLLDSYFPDGRAAAVVVRVESDRWEYWTEPNRIGRLVEIVRARVGSDRSETGTSGTSGTIET